MIIMKFGGTSLRDGAAVRRVIRAVSERRKRRPIVVLSAMNQTTDALLDAARSSEAGEVQESRRRFEELREYHLKQVSDLCRDPHLEAAAEGVEKLCGELKAILDDIRSAACCGPSQLDHVASFGERLSTWIFAQALESHGLPAVLLDSRLLVRSDDTFTTASIDFAESKRLLGKALREAVENGIAVLQGFIAGNSSGSVTTIGRGGSDLTACLSGAAVDAEEIQIWTDVPGILTADPRIVPEALKIKAISFDEAAELAYFGAKVLHPAALAPAMEAGIPVRVLDSSRLDRPGTQVGLEAVECRTPIKSIACKGGIVVLNVHSPNMLMTSGYARRVFEVFEKHRFSVDVIATSEINISVTLDRTQGLEAVVEDLAELGTVKVDQEMAIVSVVGRSLSEVKGLAARVLQTVADIEVRLISQAGTGMNLTFLIRQERMHEAVQRIHDEFFQTPDPQVFERCAEEVSA